MGRARGLGVLASLHRDDLADHCAVRHVLGHLAAHRRRPRRGPAGQPRALPDPVRAVRAERVRRARLRPAARRPGGAELGADLEELARAHRRRASDGRRRLRTARLPARRRLAPHLRPGRHPLGPDPPDADRRCRPVADRDGAAARGGPDPHRGEDAGPPLAPVHPGHGRDGRDADRAVGLPGGVRLRRTPVPAGAAAAPHRGRSRRHPGRRAALDRPRRRDHRGALLPARPRRRQRHRRPAGDRRALGRGAALPGRGGLRRGRRPSSRTPSACVRRPGRRADRHRRLRGGVLVEQRRLPPAMDR